MGIFTFLGSGGSSGVPMIGCQCSVCSSQEPRNQRMRPSGLVQMNGKNLLIDVGPDFRFQALRAKLLNLDGILLTHSHFDHVAGLDELRAYYLLHQHTLPVLASDVTVSDLKRRYDYLFHKKGWGKSLTAQLEFQIFEMERGRIEFCGIPISFFSYEQGGMQVNGYRFNRFAYVSDIRQYPESIFEDLDGVETLVLSAPRFKPSAMHFGFEEAKSLAKRVGVKRCLLTHLGHEIDHNRVSSSLESPMELGFDGQVVEF